MQNASDVIKTVKIFCCEKKDQKTPEGRNLPEFLYHFKVAFLMHAAA